MKLTRLFFNKISSFIIFTIYLLSNCYLANNIKEIYEMFAIGLTLLVIFFFFLFSFKRKKGLTLISFLLYLFSLLISCFYGTYSSIVTFFHIYYPIIGIVFYLLMSYYYNSEGTIKSLNLSLHILILINFFTIIMYPNGLYSAGSFENNWFFKYDNLHIMMFLPSFLLNLIILGKYKNKYNIIPIYINWVIIISSIFICKSATTIISFLIIIIFYIYFVYEKLRKKDNKRSIIKKSNKLMSVYLILFFCIVIFRIQDIFSWLIVNMLHKDLTFSNRTIIWDNVISYTKLKPFLGYGIENSNIFIEKMGNQAFTHAHNTILDVIYKGGLISFSFFFIFIKQIVKKIDKIIDKYSDMYKIVFFSLIIMTIVEAREEKMGFYLILFILYCIGSDSENKRKDYENV